MYNLPIAYFITFTTYGTWLHGDCRGSVIRRCGCSEKLPPNTALYNYENRLRKHPPVVLNAAQRKIVHDAVIRHCAHRQWYLIALHVRSNHLHAIVQANSPIKQVTQQLKQWSTRSLRQAGMEAPVVWTSGASRNYIYEPSKLRQKVHYVLFEQGEMMEYYVDESICL